MGIYRHHETGAGLTDEGTGDWSQVFKSPQEAGRSHMILGLYSGTVVGVVK